MRLQFGFFFGNLSICSVQENHIWFAEYMIRWHRLCMFLAAYDSRMKFACVSEFFLKQQLPKNNTPSAVRLCCFSMNFHFSTIGTMRRRSIYCEHFLCNISHILSQNSAIWRRFCTSSACRFRPSWPAFFCVISITLLKSNISLYQLPHSSCWGNSHNNSCFLWPIQSS